MMRAYHQLTKPGIVYSNTLVALAAFLFGTAGMPNLGTLAFLGIGIAFSIAGATTFNNVMDRDIDARMTRTRMRAIPAGLISVRQALAFGSLLCALGLALLYAFVGALPCFLTLAAVLLYVLVYTPAKRLTPHSTLIGTLPGALPPVIGYVAAGQPLGLIAALLFLILVAWQMTHFFAIGLYRVDDYRAADLPILPVYANARMTRHFIFLYVLVFALAGFALGRIAAAGIGYWLPLSIISLAWIALGIQGYRTSDLHRWAKRMFFVSLFALLALCVSLALA